MRKTCFQPAVACFIIAFACVSEKRPLPLEPGDDLVRPGLPIDFARDGCYTGAMVDWTTVDDGHEWMMTETDLNHYHGITGKKTAFLLAYRAFSQSGRPYALPLDFCTFARAQGAVPYVTWEPRDWDAADPRSKTQSLLPEILSGKWDGLIAGWIRDIKEFGTPILLRFGHEFNGNWYPWSGIFNGGESRGRYNDPDRSDGPRMYIEAYRYVFRKFHEAGVFNVVWAWSPNNESHPAAAWNHFKNYYPGDAFVDIIALDVYNWGTAFSWSRWKSFEEMYAAFYEEVISRWPRKPVMLGEFGCSDKGGDKAAWLRDCFRVLKEKFPRTKIFTYFHVDSTARENIDFRIDTDPGAARVMTEAMKDPYYIDTAMVK